MTKRKEELSPDEVYELATRVRNWEPAVGLNYKAKIGDFNLFIHHELTDTPYTITVNFNYVNPESKQPERICIGRLDEKVGDSSKRAHDLYSKIDRERSRKARWHKTRAINKHLEEVVKIIS
jgi:hypothetical protein